jgi:hypothetical protein
MKLALHHNMALFRPNLDNKGRVIRGVAALALGAAAGVTWALWRPAGIALGVASGFVGFEAARGWCAFRACGLKTKV